MKAISETKLTYCSNSEQHWCSQTTRHQEWKWSFICLIPVSLDVFVVTAVLLGPGAACYCIKLGYKDNLCSIGASKGVPLSLFGAAFLATMSHVLLELSRTTPRHHTYICSLLLKLILWISVVESRFCSTYPLFLSVSSPSWNWNWFNFISVMSTIFLQLHDLYDFVLRFIMNTVHCWS